MAGDSAESAQTRRYTQNLSRRFQIYRSTSTDPYLNLSIEHHLLQRSHPDSTILFLYTNRPSVVIGRNQNPWLEVNLHALRRGLPQSLSSGREKDSDHGAAGLASSFPVPISLVRRRSGGGTVFHDTGNTNYSVICPPAAFDRDKHAEMVARALLERCGVRGTVRVNERHDIVIDVENEDSDDKVVSAKKVGSSTFKVSGSAYKLTRTRSLHHGTCLLQSENLARVSPLLRSPAEGFIKARGVESVRSPIRNVGVGEEEFVEAVMAEFRKMYGDGAGKSVVVGEDEALANDEVIKGLRELTSPDWIFGQTPQFTFSTHPTEDDPRERPELKQTLPRGFQTHLTIRHGEIQSANVAGLEYPNFIDENSQDAILSKALTHQRLHHIVDWRRTLEDASQIPVEVDQVGKFLNHMFGIQTLTSKGGETVAQTIEKTISDTAVGVFLKRNAINS
ncbi:hypothetical protein C7999DRAFT_39922 [Corynascus novoguineensis]|uniref:Putative lipoate-protein ligase A n=1 Tax=Corynascus novoguineensis TaxID=1126955 RepID=A0AAN7CXW7_9PEZI|nr:hypothetical protein C7999DRAFT_39922 [Corynascus novoguineensis]